VALQQLRAHHRSHFFQHRHHRRQQQRSKKQLLTHLVGVHDNHVAIIAATLTLSNMHDSHEEAVALSLRPHPPALGRPAFVRHAAGGNSCMQRQQLFFKRVWGAGWSARQAARGCSEVREGRAARGKVFVRRARRLQSAALRMLAEARGGGAAQYGATQIVINPNAVLKCTSNKGSNNLLHFVTDGKNACGAVKTVYPLTNRAQTHVLGSFNGLIAQVISIAVHFFMRLLFTILSAFG
jgi:hypothetical protein